MKHNYIGDNLKAARVAAQLTQTRLSEMTGLSSARLSHFEKGRRLPTRNEWARIANAIRLGPYPVPHRLPAVGAQWYSQAPSLTPPERPFSTRLNAARRTFTRVDELIRTLEARDDARVCHEFLDAAALESGDEAFFYLKLLAEGCRPCGCSPQRSGYRTFPVIDPGTKAIIGDLRLPCLEIVHGDQEFLIFPQVTLLTTGRAYRLDGLVGVRCPVQKIWLDLEIDGAGHDFEFDLQRAYHLRLPTLRLGREELSSPNLLGRVSDSIKEFRRRRRLNATG